MVLRREEKEYHHAFNVGKYNTYKDGYRYNKQQYDGDYILFIKTCK